MMSRVLVVDDDIQLCELFGEVLENEGYRVDTVHCGETALDFIQSNPVDLVLLDVMLPNLIGIQVARRDSSKAPSDLATMIVTALSPVMFTAVRIISRRRSTPMIRAIP